MQQHTQPIDRSAPDGAGNAEKMCFKGCIDQIGHDRVFLEAVKGNTKFWLTLHSERACVHNGCGAFENISRLYPVVYVYLSPELLPQRLGTSLRSV